jgi:threonine/homoserine/homoserine lactone efflux protein
MTYNVFISYAIVFFYGIVLGLLSAIPIGAVQVQVVKIALRGHRKTAISTALGSGTSDFIYGILTLFGFGNFMMSPGFQFFFYILGAAVLSFILYRTIREYQHGGPGMDTALQQKNKKKRGFATGFTLAITNPGIVLWWIVGFKVFLDLGLFTEVTIPLRIAFVLSGAGGLAGYLVILAMTIARVHRNIPDRMFRRMNLALIIVFAALILYFIYKIVRCVAG